jgi:putative membrane protein
MSDASILASFDRANLIDSAAGVIAASKATGAELRGFAAQMVRDHHAMRVEGERVARRLRLTPESTGGNDGESDLAPILTVLNATARGRDFDKAYIDHEVAFHLDFLETVTGAMELASETEVKAFIQKLAPMLEEHLNRAQALQARLR